MALKRFKRLRGNDGDTDRLTTLALTEAPQKSCRTDIGALVGRLRISRRGNRVLWNGEAMAQDHLIYLVPRVHILQGSLLWCAMKPRLLILVCTRTEETMQLAVNVAGINEMRSSRVRVRTLPAWMMLLTI